ncbi:AraC-like DNA-binding protein [Chryseobacterium rhizosphaerae]|jgi:AraC-like DNA-binding protein|uniref:helix-turn-helix domain-containing protein n=1 Tax=Chryseobacterium rhizosphaerae TaxID=395937 RepID=UPI0006487E2E|nr:helix-turn-helix domain-containing protein [Chryseobacterium rhizosphaerae]MDR6545048.1 AraC-like DNA-binding protein [Chryseobacterium rhizosphaerae]
MRPEDIKLFYSCTSEKYVVDENVVPAHSITYLYEGEFEMSNGTELIRLERRALFYTAKNTLFRFTKIASKTKPFKSLTIVFSDKFLEEYFQKNSTNLNHPTTDRNFQLKDHLLWNNFFGSLKPYVEMQDAIPEDLVIAKQLEALGILRCLYPGIDHLLSNFEIPGKINLEKFMQQNYIFNLPLQRFAYLTGRSLSTFQRDFLKIFETTPQRWLTQKRLELAHYLIEDKKMKPSEAYIEVGFENLSHFSRAFKAEFGYNARTILNV